MSQENVDLVAALYAAGAQMEQDELLAALPALVEQACDPEIEWVEDPRRVDGRIYRGHSGVLESWQKWLDQFDQHGWEVEEIRDCGDHLDKWLAAYCADDIDYRAAEGALDDRGPMHGKDAVRAYAQDWLDMFDDLKVEPVELIDAGEDQVIAVLRNSGRAKLSSWRGLRIL